MIDQNSQFRCQSNINPLRIAVGSFPRQLDKREPAMRPRVLDGKWTELLTNHGLKSCKQKAKLHTSDLRKHLNGKEDCRSDNRKQIFKAQSHRL